MCCGFCRTYRFAIFSCTRSLCPNSKRKSCKCRRCTSELDDGHQKKWDLYTYYRFSCDGEDLVSFHELYIGQGVEQRIIVLTVCADAIHLNL
ncbi:MAG: hypothetical protein M2R45_04900 [Verrucomicrobia subdivision 3 bacterium]|nr:hypothetical protein [Limisphaerales bacterium]MCS1417553.1 hypothetical protein [Limisphaerales bacterium]